MKKKNIKSCRLSDSKRYISSIIGGLFMIVPITAYILFRPESLWLYFLAIALPVFGMILMTDCFSKNIVIEEEYDTVQYRVSAFSIRKAKETVEWILNTIGN